MIEPARNINNANDGGEFCPSCGKNVDNLNEVTGWCEDCTPVVLRLDYARNNKQRIEAFLKNNANELEFYIVNGDSLRAALVKLSSDRPRCVSCGKPFHRAKRTSIFCRRTQPCRRFSRRYVYLYREKGLSKAEALAKVLEEIT